MVHLDATLAHEREAGGTSKGLKGGALGLLSSVVVGVASTAPAYSLAATLGFIVIAIGGFGAPIVAILAFVPMLFISYAYKELNFADPDCGTTFTWATRAFGPKTGWFGGWGIIAADILVMASLAQIAGQYVFLLFGAGGIGSNASSTWVLLVGILWIVLMTAICYVGIEVSANTQKVLLSIELTILLLFSVVALIKVGAGHAPAGHVNPSAEWFNPLHNMSFYGFMSGFTLMLFIYWGWDTSVSVNEETKDSRRTPGRAAVLATVILLVTYVLVIMASQSYAGIGIHGIGLGNSANENDVINVLGTSVFGTSGIGWFMTKLLLLMVLTSAAASTQTTILPTARTTLSMATYKAIPDAFGRVHKRFLTPSVSTLTMGGISIALYAVLNYRAHGNVIADSVTALGAMIAFYYGLTGFACVWYYRKTLTKSTRNLWMQGIIPLAGAVMLWFAMFWFLWYNWIAPVTESYSTFMLWGTHRVVGEVLLIELVAILVGVVLFFVWWAVRPAFFRGEVLNKDTPTLVPEDLGTPIGLFGIDESGNGASASDGGAAAQPETTSS